MSQEQLRIEFRVSLGKRPSAPKLEPGAKVERQRQDRADRRARNLALAYWIDHLIRTGQVADLAAVARMCGVSRSRLTKVVAMHGMAATEQDRMATSGLQCPPIADTI